MFDECDWPKVFKNSISLNNFRLTWSLATRKWISDKAILTDTVRIVVSHNTVCIPAAETGAGVDTLLVFASFVSGTVNIVETLGSAVGREPSHAGQAGTVTSSVLPHWRVGIRTTGVWLTGIICFHRQYCWNRTVGATCFGKQSMRPGTFQETICILLTTMLCV